MQFSDRIKVLIDLGNAIEAVVDLSDISELTPAQKELSEQMERVHVFNAWFTKSNVVSALKGIRRLLLEDELIEYSSSYIKGIEGNTQAIPVGIIMAGNLPLVGMHDFICVFLSGHKALIKLSSDDDKLFPILTQIMIEGDKAVESTFEIQRDKLHGFEKVIATGSDNTARHFEYYFRNVPSVIRKSRTSVAVLAEGTSNSDIEKLAKDLFSYFGLGCRSVSKLMIHQSVDLPDLITELIKHTEVLDCVKYQNNLDYNKSIFLINKVEFLDGGAFLLKEDESLFSPISVIHYQKYDNLSEVDKYLSENKAQIQCVVGNRSEDLISLGEAQLPRLSDYADGVDIMDFLLK